MDYNLHFRVIYGEFLQTYEGTKNDMTPRTVDAIAMGPNGNLQGGIRCMSLGSGRFLDRQWKDVEIYKMPESAINRINHMARQQKSVKGLKFGDRQNLIDYRISIGVIEDEGIEEDNLINNIDSDIMIEEENPEDNADGINNAEDSENRARFDVDIAQEDPDMDDELVNEVSVENRYDEFAASEGTSLEEGVTVTRSGRISRPPIRYPAPETANFQEDSSR